MKISKELQLVTIPQMEINDSNELVQDDKEYLVRNNDLRTKELVFEKGRWV